MCLQEDGREIGTGGKEAVKCPAHSGMSPCAAEPGVFRHPWNGGHVTE